MVVISDTTTITNLLKIEKIHILKNLFGKVIIPQAVRDELGIVEHHEEFLASCDWIEVSSVIDVQHVAGLLADLGKGEAEAIVLAIEQQVDYLIIDELKGRIKAKELGVPIIGLLGILTEAKKAGVITFVKPVIDELTEKANFYIHPNLYHFVIKTADEK